jgi:hypothetical protein
VHCREAMPVWLKSSFNRFVHRIYVRAQVLALRPCALLRQ